MNDNEEFLIMKRKIYQRLQCRYSWFNIAARVTTGKFVNSALEFAYGLGRADAEDKKCGVWNSKFSDNGWMDHICSNCGYTINTDVHVVIDYNFCPGCGSPMQNGMNKTSEEDESKIIP